MADVPPLTDEEVSQWKTAHYHWQIATSKPVCHECMTVWPCSRARAAARIEQDRAEIARLTGENREYKDALVNADREVKSLTVSLELVKCREERLTAENTQLREANDLATRCHEHDHKCTEKIVSALRQIAGLDYDSQCCTEDEECTHEACLNTFRARAISRAALARLEKP